MPSGFPSTMLDDVLDANQTSIRRVVDEGLLAGAVTLVWHRGEVVQVNEIGRRDVGADLPMRRDTVFRIASMSKPITVAAAMALRDAGRLHLDDPVTRWLPELSGMRVLDRPGGPLGATSPALRDITVEDLMTHRSGLGYSFTVAGPLAQAYRRVGVRGDPSEWLAEIAALPLENQPGEAMTYGVSTDVLGILLARIEGVTTAEVLRRHVTGPLGMTDTAFSLSPAQRARAATMYRLDGDTLRDDAMRPPPVTEPRLCPGGSGLMSTADDYLTFARMLLRGGEVDGVRVLSEESVRLMRTDRLTAAQRRATFLGMPYWSGRGFGLNLAVVTDPAQSQRLFGPGGLGSFGWPGAYGTWWQADPGADLIVLYLVQNYPDFTADLSTALAGNAAHIALQSAQPRFVRTTYAQLVG